MFDPLESWTVISGRGVGGESHFRREAAGDARRVVNLDSAVISGRYGQAVEASCGRLCDVFDGGIVSAGGAEIDFVAAYIGGWMRLPVHVDGLLCLPDAGKRGDEQNEEKGWDKPQ